MAKRLGYWLYQAYWSTLDWVFPPKCWGCGKTGTRWCIHCDTNAQKITTPVCPVCGQLSSDICQRCQRAMPRYTALRSWAVFEGSVRNAVHQLKYHRNIGLGEMMARPLVDLIRNLKWSIDWITPVPLGLARLAERGYNQSSLLARPISMALGIPYRPRILNRTRKTRSQVGLTIEERRLNVAGAFVALSDWTVGRSVLVIDDVTNSGSTLEACADALFGAGARQVYGLTLARAVIKSPQLTEQAIHDS
jgi:competence protein ComFC